VSDDEKSHHIITDKSRESETSEVQKRIVYSPEVINGFSDSQTPRLCGKLRACFCKIGDLGGIQGAKVCVRHDDPLFWYLYNIDVVRASFGMISFLKTAREYGRTTYSLPPRECNSRHKLHCGNGHVYLEYESASIWTNSEKHDIWLRVGPTPTKTRPRTQILSCSDFNAPPSSPRQTYSPTCYINPDGAITMDDSPK
jgi:hypothetical protein